MDETIRFYAGGDLPLLFEFFEDAAETTVYPMVGATVEVHSNGTGVVPTISNPGVSQFLVNWTGAQTLTIDKNKTVKFQLKVTLTTGEIIITPPIHLVAL